ncbi:Fibronectin type-III domain-containing protein [Caenorhabditis elegans]|uniref:Fibronectin type-III domain-containing protein n=1 Tax=Caenorhabditis elegans TaxID=6239 RepID=O45090_CAEEL|nr:Fibronectin type-III domain-containing protein [Caenorhabditis elegans]CCD67284.2 Fibronectin type-III domain-containing protein [Caenorhabditis elegans]|eukprot:NP_001343638.1 Uncharacterized protein CELE_F58H7.1 [Caenorhabditis elegans]
MKSIKVSFSILIILLFSTTISPTIANSAPPDHQDVDHIEDIEVEETQVIITTTKQGPAEHLKIHIELVDIEANKRVNPVDLSGLWLTITRGRYTIPFLRPDTWYGVRFRSENTINGHTVVHEDERLVKTRPRPEAAHNLAESLLGPPMVLPTLVGLPAFPPTIGVGVYPTHGPNGLNALNGPNGLSGPNSQVPHDQNHMNGQIGSPFGFHGPNSPNGPNGLNGLNDPNGSNSPNRQLPHEQSDANGQAQSHGPFGFHGLQGPISQNVQAGTHASNEHGLNSPNGPNNPNDHQAPDANAIDVKMHRSLDGVENFESIYITAGWKDTEMDRRSNLTTGVVKLRVICDHSETKEEIKLKGDEDSVTIEITMDQKYDIEEMEKHHIKAHITPLKCHKICWTTDLVLSSGFGDFTKHLGSECKEISGTTSTTFLRNIKKVSVIENQLSENELVVETEVPESEYGIVTLILQKLGGNDTEEPVKKTFDTATSNGRFVVPVEDDAIYAVIYEYLKKKPFHYTSKAHFLVESPAINSTKPSHPLVDVSVIPTSFDYKHDKKESVLKPEPPFLLISRSPMYAHNDLLVKIEPFCNETEVKFRLEDRYPQHQVDAVPFLCALNPKMYFCDRNVTSWHKCDSTLCFSTSVLIGLDSFEADTRCLNVTQHFPPLISTSYRPSLFVCVSLLAVLSRHLLYYATIF